MPNFLKLNTPHKHRLEISFLSLLIKLITYSQGTDAGESEVEKFCYSVFALSEDSILQAIQHSLVHQSHYVKRACIEKVWRLEISLNLIYYVVSNT